MWTPRQILLAGALAVLGGGAWWLLETRMEEVKPPVPRNRLPDHVVTDFSAVETDETGQPERRLAARQLRHYVKEDLSELDLPRLTVFESDSPPWQGESQTGLLLSGGDEVRLTGAARLSRASDGTSRSLRLMTEEITIWPKGEYAAGDQPVRIESDQDWLTAAGVKLWYSTPARAEFQGRAHILLAPKPGPEAASEETDP